MNRKQRRKEAAERTLLKVPNSAKGRKFLADLRKYATSGTRVWARGRGPRAEHARKVYPGTSGRAFDQSLPVEYAAYFGVYVWKPAFQEIANKREREAFSQAWELRKENEAIRACNGSLREEADQLASRVNELLMLNNALRAEAQAPKPQEVKVLLTVSAQVIS